MKEETGRIDMNECGDRWLSAMALVDEESKFPKVMGKKGRNKWRDGEISV